jgi:protein-tyrosine phosphatase
MLLEIGSAAPQGPVQDEARFRVLFVCHGNICRSPMAEGILRTKLKEAGLLPHVLVASAGTATHRAGRRADGRARMTLKKHGATIHDLRTRLFDDGDFKRFDLILAMDERDRRELLSRMPQPTDLEKIRLLLDYVEGGELADPVEGTRRHFERTYEVLDRACDALLETIKVQLQHLPLASHASPPP